MPDVPVTHNDSAQSTDSRTHRPDGAWAFDASVVAVFDDMLARSIPQYEVMRDAVVTVGASFLPLNSSGLITDLGASRGEMTARFLTRFGAQHKYLCCEVSPPMLDALRARFEGWTGTEQSGVGARPIVSVRALDLRKDYPHDPSDVTLAVLTLQFTPIEYRSRIVRDAYRATKPGGVMIVVEKVLGGTLAFDSLFIDQYLALKSANGYDADAIERKRLSLEGVLVPITAHWNEELLHAAGFTHVECFWRWMNFAAWVAIKD